VLKLSILLFITAIVALPTATAQWSCPLKYWTSMHPSNSSEQLLAASSVWPCSPSAQLPGSPRTP
jgi:hypothetical protein